MFKKYLLTLFAFTIFLSTASSQRITNHLLDDSILPLKTERTISFVTDEGSYMNVDISPDGKKILFDLLGDIYLISSSGGVAKQLIRGIDVKQRPIWAPSQEHFAYLTDVCGALCIRVLDLGGNIEKSIKTKETLLSDIITMIWSPDGKSIILNDSLYNVFENRYNKPKFSLFPFGFSKDGRFSYYRVKNVGSGLARCILKRDNTSGLIDTVFYKKNEWLQNVKISPDGRWLTFIKGPWNSPTDSLWVVDLKSKKERLLTVLSFRVPSTRFTARNCNYSFSADSKTLYIAYGGKIRKINLDDASSVNVTFTANVNVDLAGFNHNVNRVPDSLLIKFTRDAHKSRDGKKIVFSALSQIYTMTLPNGSPRVVGKQAFGQFQPSFSPDGERIAYVSFEDGKGGHLWTVSASGGEPQKITNTPGFYQNPSWSFDGQSIVLVKAKSTNVSSHLGEIVVFSLRDKLYQVIDDSVPMLNRPVFSRNDREITYKPLIRNNFDPNLNEGKQIVPQLVATNLLTNETRLVATGATFDQWNHPDYQQLSQILSSPDGRYIVYQYMEALYLFRLNNLSGAQLIYAQTLDLPTLQITHGGQDPHWENDGTVLSWSFANRYYSISRGIIDSLLDQLPIKGSVSPQEIVDIKLELPRAYSSDVLAFKNARIITMWGDSIIERGTVIIRNGKFSAVGKNELIEIPAAARVFDLNGKTIIPGLVDLHSHTNVEGDDILLQQPWQFLANLAYGVTTLRDPSGNFNLLGYNELIETGKIKGPRCFGVGSAVRGGNFKLEDFGEVKSLVQNRLELGAAAIKQYSLRTRLQRQWLQIAAREARLNITNEGSMSYQGVLGMLKDGSSGIEHHNPLGYDIYKDVLKLIAKSNTYFTPTLQISNQGGEEGQVFFRNLYRSFRDVRKLRHFLPSVEMSSIMQTSQPKTYPDFIIQAKQCYEIHKLGGHIIMGSHGQDQGIGAHFEIWALHMGGMNNLDVLRAATIGGAEALGVEQDIGSIEVGKIADLIVLDKNPLMDIRNSISIDYVMKNGILYDDESLDVVSTHLLNY